MNNIINYSRRAVVENYATFSGRDNRAQYWYYVLGVVLVSVILNVLASLSDALSILAVLFSIAVLIPSIAATTRRLHDTGRSGWWQLIQVIPVIGFIVILYFTVQQSSPAPNKYGAGPSGNGTGASAYPPPPPPAV